MTRARLWLALGATYGFLAVVMGAVGAHALQGSMSPRFLDFWQTAVRFQFYHALALLALGVFAMIRPTSGQTLSGVGFAFGILLFSGSLYALCLSGAPVIAMITPVGGTSLLFGWLALIWSASRYDPRS